MTGFGCDRRCHRQFYDVISSNPHYFEMEQFSRSQKKIVWLNVSQAESGGSLVDISCRKEVIFPIHQVRFS